MTSCLIKHHQKGFSTLMALGTIGILLIIVTGLATTYIREMRLSRTSYDEVLAYANAEGMFEYAMLKVRNHREGFSDSVTHTELDSKMLIPTTERAKGMQSSYMITANGKEYDTELTANNHLILPLFSARESEISGMSKNPQYNTGVDNTTNLSVELGALSWTIIAMSGGMSLGLTGSGDIIPTTDGVIRHKTSRCYSANDATEIPCNTIDRERGDEELEYFYDEIISIAQFLRDNRDPYLMVFNDSTRPQSIRIRGDSPFALPVMRVHSEAQKNDSVQVFEFREDKSKYYDALKYGVYNAD